MIQGQPLDLSFGFVLHLVCLCMYDCVFLMQSLYPFLLKSVYLVFALHVLIHIYTYINFIT